MILIWHFTILRLCTFIWSNIFTQLIYLLTSFTQCHKTWIFFVKLMPNSKYYFISLWVIRPLLILWILIGGKLFVERDFNLTLHKLTIVWFHLYIIFWQLKKYWNFARLESLFREFHTKYCLLLVHLSAKVPFECHLSPFPSWKKWRQKRRRFIRRKGRMKRRRIGRRKRHVKVRPKLGY